MKLEITQSELFTYDWPGAGKENYANPEIRGSKAS